MRTLALVLLVACGSATTPSPSPSRSPSPIGHGSVVEDFVAHATLVVRGVASTDTRGAEYTGSIRVESIYKGACPSDIAFVAPPFEPIDHDAIMFLVRDGARWRLTLTGPRSEGLSPTEETSVIAAIHDTPSSPDGFASDLKTFRDARGASWLPANQPAVMAADRIFGQLSWIGATPAIATKLLGEPDEVDPHHAWHYIRHNGESGVIRVLRMQDDRVVAVDVHLTQ